MTILVMVCCVLAAGTAVMAFPATFYTWTLSNTTHVDGVSAWFADPWAQYDGKWSDYGGYVSSDGSWMENTPRIVTTIAGLNPTSFFDVYVCYFTAYNGSNMKIVAV